MASEGISFLQQEFGVMLVQLLVIKTDKWKITDKSRKYRYKSHLYLYLSHNTLPLHRKMNVPGFLLLSKLVEDRQHFLLDYILETSSSKLGVEPLREKLQHNVVCCPR